jgi:hypothetical protein
MLAKKFSSVYNRKMRDQMKFLIIIVFSLNTIPNFTIRNLSKIIGNESKSFVDLWTKRLVTSTLKGSFSIWIKVKHRTYDDMNPKYTLAELEQKENSYK